MEGNDRESAPRHKQLGGCTQRGCDNIKLGIDSDPYGLKCTLRGIAGGRCKPCGNYRAADICKLRGRFYRCVGTNLAYPCCDLSRKPLLTETRNNIGDLVLRICIDDNGGSKCRAVVHTHVERSVMNIRKAALGCVELI